MFGEGRCTNDIKTEGGQERESLFSVRFEMSKKNKPREMEEIVFLKVHYHSLLLHIPVLSPNPSSIC